MFKKSIYAVPALLLALCSAFLNSYAADSDTLWCHLTYPTINYAVKFTPDGQYIASGGSNGVVTIWNALTGDSVKSYSSNQTIYRFDINNTGTLIAIPFFYDSINVYNMQTNTLVASMKGALVKFSSDGNYLVTDEGKIYETQTWSVVGSYTNFSKYPDPQNGENMLDISISPDNNYLATGGMTYKNGVSISNIIRLYKLSNLKDSVYYTLEKGTLGTPYPRVCFSPDGKYLASEASDDTVRIWTLPDRKVYRKFCHSSEVDAIAFSPDGKYLVEGGGYYQHHNINIWNISSEALVYTYPHIDVPFGINISFNGNYIAVANGSGINVYNAKWNPNSVSEDPVTITENTIYPNPTINTAILKFNLSYSCNLKIIIYDISGNLLNTIYNDLMTSGDKSINIDCSKYPNGTYYCTIETKNSKDTINLVISK